MRRFHGSNIANRIVETERLYMREAGVTDAEHSELKYHQGFHQRNKES